MSYNRIDDEQATYDYIYRMLEMSEEYLPSELHYQVAEIMQYPEYYPEYMPG